MKQFVRLFVEWHARWNSHPLWDYHEFNAPHALVFMLHSIFPEQTLNGLARICLVFLLVACESDSHNDSFTTICDIVTEAAVSSSDSTQFKSAKADQIWLRVKTELSPDDAARDVFLTLATVPPDQKYSLFKEAAEQQLGTTWDCPGWPAPQRE